MQKLAVILAADKEWESKRTKAWLPLFAASLLYQMEKKNVRIVHTMF